MAETKKIAFVIPSEICDDDGLIIHCPMEFCFNDHEPIKREQFHVDLDEVFLEYKALVNRQKAVNFVEQADKYQAQADALRACGTPEERDRLKVTQRAENKLSEEYGLSPEKIREVLAAAAAAA